MARSMSWSDTPRGNSSHAWIEDASVELWKAAQDALEAGEAGHISDEAVARLMTTAVKLYFAKADGEDRTFRPLLGRKDQHLSPTEVLSAVSEVLRAMHLGPMELALWYRRRPDEPHHSADDEKHGDVP